MRVAEAYRPLEYPPTTVNPRGSVALPIGGVRACRRSAEVDEAEVRGLEALRQSILRGAPDSLAEPAMTQVSPRDWRNIPHGNFLNNSRLELPTREYVL